MRLNTIIGILSTIKLASAACAGPFPQCGGYIFFFFFFLKKKIK